jgi:hypothetical protein
MGQRFLSLTEYRPAGSIRQLLFGINGETGARTFRKCSLSGWLSGE